MERSKFCRDEKYWSHFFCVFHSKFPDRVLKNGKPVVEYNDIVEYILEKDNDIKVDFLNIEGRNKVLYKSFTI